MSRYPNSNAIVLSVTEASEKDLEAVLLHETLGKRRLVAKGARASLKGSAAALQAGNIIHCQVYRGRNHDTLQQVEILQSPLGLIITPDKLLCLHYFLWLLQAWCEWDSPVPELYELLRLAISTLIDYNDPSLERLKRRFEAALLRAEGLADAGISFAEFQQQFSEHTHVGIPQRFWG